MPVKKPADPDPKATPLEAGAPVEAPALSQMGSTFAERAQAAKASAKQVDSDDEKAENKAVKSAASKSRKS